MFADHRFPSHEEYVIDLNKETAPLLSDHLGLGGASPQGDTIAFTNFYMTYNNRPCIPVMGEFHSSRFPRQYWKQELQKMQAGGVQIIATYILWIHIEEDEDVFEWSGDRDIRTFVELCQSLGLQVLLRIGPFAHGECRNGGLPDWLYGQPFAVRSNDPRYLAYVQRYFSEIAQQIKGLLFRDGGPVIGLQIENEYMHSGAPWEVTYKQGSEWVPAGSDGVEHMERLKQLALAVGLQTPIYSCTGWVGSPVPEQGFIPMQGGYAFTPWNPDPDYRQEPTWEFLFRDRHLQPLAHAEATYDPTRYPYASCELGGGIQITYHHRPIVPPECVQAMAVVALGSGANLLGYYMYHGGSNPIGKHAFLNEFTVPRISYDFQAPVGEYGQIHASYHHLRVIHLFLQDFGERLAPMEVVLPEHCEQITPEESSTLRYAARCKDGSGFLFLNNYQDHVAMQDHEEVCIRLNLPGESFSLPHMREGLTLCKDVSAILPFNMSLDEGILLKYATAQVLTKISSEEQTAYIFFLPQGMHGEFVLDGTTYRSVEVAGGTFHEEEGRGYVVVEAGLQSCIHITAMSGKMVDLFLLTQEQAHTCWKVQLEGQERLVLTEALVLQQGDALHLSWRDGESVSLALYPPLKENLNADKSQLPAIEDGYFTRYKLAVAGYKSTVIIETLSNQDRSIRIPATAMDGIHDIFLRIDYSGDTGQAYLCGHLVSDHFANGLPWEIGLKRFMAEQEEQELILHFTPLRQDAGALRYFPTGMAFRPASDGTNQVEVNSIVAIPEYHVMLTLDKQTDEEKRS